MTGYNSAVDNVKVKVDKPLTLNKCLLNHYLTDYINVSCCNVLNKENRTTNICRSHPVGVQDGYANIPHKTTCAVDINNNKPNVIHDNLVLFRLKEDDNINTLPIFDKLFDHEVNESASTAADNTHDKYTYLFDNIKANISAIDDVPIQSQSRLELDSHANMPVVGSSAYILNESGESAEVNAFSPDYPTRNIPIVDAALQYESPYDGKTYILVIRNALYVPSMKNNLIPPFILREAGIEVNDVPKIHMADPDETAHSLFFTETNFRIPLSLWGIFSYLPVSKPSEDELTSNDDVYLLTPSRWNPHSSAYASNESNMLDWQGNIKPVTDRQTILLSDIPDDDSVSSAVAMGSIETKAILDILDSIDEEPPAPTFHKVPLDADEVASTYARVDPLLNDHSLHAALSSECQFSKYKTSIGAVHAHSCKYLFEDSDPVGALDGDDSHHATASAVDLAPPHDHPKGNYEGYLIDQNACSADISAMDTLLGSNDLAKQSLLKMLDLDDLMVSAVHGGRHKGVTPSELAKLWRIDVNTASKTIDITSQRSVRTSNPKLSRNYGTNDRMLRYKHLKQYFYMDTLFATSKAKKSSRGHTCAQLFVTDKGFVYIVPMTKENQVLHAVKQFAKAVGAPDAIICDAARAQKSADVKRFCNDIGTTLRVLETDTPWANKAELYIGILKEAVRKDMKEANCPLAFWDYCLERRARINNLTAKDLFSLHGTNAHTELTGEEGDISSLCQYTFYDWCYYREHNEQFPFNREVLGRVLGPALGEGNEMCQWVLRANGNVVPRRTLRPLRVDEIHSNVEQKKRDTFDALIEGRWGTSTTPPNESKNPKEDPWEEYSYDDESPRQIPDIEDTVDATGKLICQQPAYDKLINAEVHLQHGNKVQAAKVIQRSLGPDGNTNGSYDDNPFLNSLLYDVEFADGTIKEYSANVIAENMLTQVDAEGFSKTMMESIIDHKMDESTAVSKADKYIVTNRGQKKLRKTTCGWSLLVKWKDESESWIPLKDLKEAHPVELAEYARARAIDDEAAFAWWVPYTLRKRDIILSSVKSRIRKTTHKYGIEVPTSLKHAFKLDEQNGDGFWRAATNLEMTNVGVAFQVLGENEKAPPGWSKVTGHLVFDVKMDFTRKARWVLDGHKTPDPIGSTYAGVVSRESVRIALTYAALNDLDVFAGDIRNAYLQAPSSQKDYIICGPEFGLENVGRVALIHRALYGGKTAGRDFRNHLRSCMRHLDFISCPADPDVWMRPAKKSDGSPYYEYVLLYVDDCLVISENAEDLLTNEIGRYFELKPNSVGPPKYTWEDA